jgi:hypothetical protein
MYSSVEQEFVYNNTKLSFLISISALNSLKRKKEGCGHWSTDRRLKVLLSSTIKRGENTKQGVKKNAGEEERNQQF